jgi:hypothetical protein
MAPRDHLELKLVAADCIKAARSSGGATACGTAG